MMLWFSESEHKTAVHQTGASGYKEQSLDPSARALCQPTGLLLGPADSASSSPVGQKDTLPTFLPDCSEGWSHGGTSNGNWTIFSLPPIPTADHPHSESLLCRAPLCALCSTGQGFEGGDLRSHKKETSIDKQVWILKLLSFSYICLFGIDDEVPHQKVLSGRILLNC